MSIVTTRAKVEEAIVLAAGFGSRMQPYSNGSPKPLIPVFDTPLLDYALKNLEEIGIRKTVVVLGYKAETVHQWLAKAEFAMEVEDVYNPRYYLGNGISAQCGLKHTVTNNVLIGMADHLALPDLFDGAVERNHHGVDLGLVVDYNPCMKPQLDDPTRVLVNNCGKILEIGKDISTWNCVDTGVFVVSRRFDSVVETIVQQNGDCTISNAVNHMITSNMDIQAWDSDGAFWLDIDTPSDLQFAEKTILSNPELLDMFEISLKKETLSTWKVHDLDAWSSNLEGKS
jgi:choline kinase